MENETIIAELFMHFMSLSQIRIRMYSPENKYRNIPFLLFKINDESDNKLQYLKNVIDKYDGCVKWTIYLHPYNRRPTYILSTKEDEQWCFDYFYSKQRGGLSQMEYYGKDAFEKYCDAAIADIPHLATYLEKSMNLYTV